MSVSWQCSICNWNGFKSAAHIAPPKRHFDALDSEYKKLGGGNSTIFFKNSPRKVGEDEPNFMSMLFRWVGWVVKTHQPEKGAEARRIFSQKIMGSFQWYGGFLKWWYPTTIGFPTKNDHFGVFWGYHHLREHPYEPLKTNGVSTWMLDAFQGDFEQLLMWVRQTGWCSMPYHGTYEFQCLKWTQPFFVLGTVLGEKEMLQSSPK